MVGALEAQTAQVVLFPVQASSRRAWLQLLHLGRPPAHSGRWLAQPRHMHTGWRRSACGILQLGTPGLAHIRQSHVRTNGEHNYAYQVDLLMCDCADNVWPWLWTENKRKPLATKNRHHHRHHRHHHHHHHHHHHRDPLRAGLGGLVESEGNVRSAGLGGLARRMMKEDDEGG